MDDEASNREALAYACRQVEADPGDGIFWLLRGHCHYRLGELEEAASSYERAAELGEEHSHAYYFWGVCLIELDRIPEAVVPLRTQLEAIPDHLDALFLLGLCLRQLDQREESDVLLDRVRDIDTGFYESMLAQYADLLAADTDDPFIRQGLRDAARALRDRG